MCWRLGMALLAVILPFVAGLEAAEPTCLERTLPVTVRDKDGKLVEGLTRRDFHAVFRGQPVEVSSTEWDERPRRIVVLLDASGDASAPRPFGMARRSAEEMASLAGRGNRVALLTCGEQIGHVISLTQDREDISRWRAWASEGDACGGACGDGASNAMREALGVLESPVVGDSLYVVSDGVTKPTGLTQAEELLLRAGVRVFVLLLRQTRPDFLPETADVYPNDFLTLAENTGGLAIIPTWGFVSRQDEEITQEQEEQQEAALLRAAQLYRQLHRQMAEFYRVRVRLPPVVDKGRKWTLEVVDEQGKRRKDLTVIYPQRLFPCEEDNADAP